MPLKCFDQRSEDGRIIGQSKSFLAGLPKELLQKEHTNSYQDFSSSPQETPLPDNRMTVAIAMELALGLAREPRRSWPSGHANAQIELYSIPSCCYVHGSEVVKAESV